MPLQNKFLLYSPEITLEIFTLIWDKLKLMFPNGKVYDYVDNNFDNFRRSKYISIWGGNDKEGQYSFGVNNNPGGGNKETTVQEILGYDPYVKEFILPEKWCVKVQSNNKPEEIAIWRENKTPSSWSNPGYLDFSGWHHMEIQNDLTEITFDQFKKYVLKENIEVKEDIPEYAECIQGYTGIWFKVGDIYKVENGTIKVLMDDKNYFTSNYNTKEFQFKNMSSKRI